VCTPTNTPVALHEPATIAIAIAHSSCTTDTTLTQETYTSICFSGGLGQGIALHIEHLLELPVKLTPSAEHITALLFHSGLLFNVLLWATGSSGCCTWHDRDSTDCIHVLLQRPECENTLLPLNIRTPGQCGGCITPKQQCTVSCYRTENPLNYGD
jgi:hypothetical protein